MQTNKGYYCLIQYCPDYGRLEAANIGVLVFCPERQFLKAMTSKNNSRVRRFFGSTGYDWINLNFSKQGLQDRLQNEQHSIRDITQLEHFIATQANYLQITSPRPMKITEPEHDLQELYSELIGETSKANPKKQSLKNALAEKLEKPELLRKVRKDLTVNVPIFNRELDVPYGYQNGRFNLIKPLSFTAEKSEQSLSTACKYAVEGRSLYDTEDPKLGKLKLVVVGKFRSGDRSFAENVRRVFKDNQVDLYRFNEISKLVDEIQQHGKNIPTLTE